MNSMRRRNRKPDTQYLKWIRTQLCALRTVADHGKCRGSVEAHHAGIRGLLQKADDRTAIPLCSKHHRLGPDSFHRLGKAFWQHHQLDRDALILNYQHAFETGGRR